MRFTILTSLAIVLPLSMTACGAQDGAAGGQAEEAQTNEASATAKVLPSDALESAIVDAVQQRYSKPMTAAASAKLPSSIVCGKTELSALASQKLTTDTSGTEILLDQSDGDQVGGFFFVKSELEALAAKKVTKIGAKSYNGYWWSDGSHYAFSNTSCRLQ